MVAAAPTKPAIPTPDELEAAWTRDKRPSKSWKPRPWVSVADRMAFGRAARQVAPRSDQGALEFAADRDPVAIILAQEADRLKDLLPLRHGRMADSAFAYYRGTPAVMALDLVDDASERHHRPGQRRRPHLELRPVRIPGADARLRRQRLRRDAARSVGMGRQAPRRERRDRGAQQRLHRGRGTATAVLASVRAYREQMARVCRDAPARHLVRPDHGRRHRSDVGRGGQAIRVEGRSRRPVEARLEASLREGARQGPDAARAASSPPSSTASGGSSTTRRWSPTSRPRAAAAGARQDVPRLPGDHGREPARARRALPVRRLRAQGRRRRQRRDPLLHRPPRGPRRERSADPPGQGGDRVGARAVSRATDHTRTTANGSSSASG